MVTPRVRRDPARRPWIRRLRCGPAVRARTNHQAAGPGQDAPWIGAPFGVPVGALHPAVKAGGLAVAQILAGRGEHLSGGEAQRVQPRLPSRGAEAVGEGGGGHPPMLAPPPVESSARPGLVAQSGDQTRVLKQAQLALLGHVDDHGVVRLPPQQERHDAFTASRRVLLHAFVAVDPHAPNSTKGV